MILEKLMEKKDILAYIKWRMAVLEILRKRIPEKEVPKKRECAIKQMKGRMKELRVLRKCINEGIKKASMNECENFHILNKTPKTPKLEKEVLR